MRILRNLSMSVVLTFAFASSGFAGIIPTVPEPDPQPPPSSLTTAPESTETPLSDVHSVTASSNVVFEVALSLLQAALF